MDVPTPNVLPFLSGGVLLVALILAPLGYMALKHKTALSGLIKSR